MRVSHNEFWETISRTDCCWVVLQPVHGLAKHLYHSLTAIYSALYRTTSPLMLDWRKDEISELLGKDPDLIRLFCDIKTEMYWFRKYFHLRNKTKNLRELTRAFSRRREKSTLFWGCIAEDTSRGQREQIGHGSYQSSKETRDLVRDLTLVISYQIPILSVPKFLHDTG
jgi:hypothetical protein